MLLVYGQKTVDVLELINKMLLVNMLLIGSKNWKERRELVR